MWNAVVVPPAAAIVVPVLLSFVAAAAFIVPAAMSGGENLMPVLFQSAEKAKLQDLARILDLTTEAMAKALEAQGFVVHSDDLSLAEITSDSGRPPMHALSTVLRTKGQ